MTQKTSHSNKNASGKVTRNTHVIDETTINLRDATGRQMHIITEVRLKNGVIRGYVQRLDSQRCRKEAFAIRTLAFKSTLAVWTTEEKMKLMSGQNSLAARAT